jgi:hypothetical protein
MQMTLAATVERCDVVFVSSFGGSNAEVIKAGAHRRGLRCHPKSRSRPGKLRHIQQQFTTHRGTDDSQPASD